MARLTRKTALVTGASRVVGRATALALAKAGARVLVHGIVRSMPTSSIQFFLSDIGARSSSSRERNSLRMGEVFVLL
jgi:NAD(P)-dependent dehydrogenase (short-subunit alcohol dehydrogenase family)